MPAIDRGPTSGDVTTMLERIEVGLRTRVEEAPGRLAVAGGSGVSPSL